MMHQLKAIVGVLAKPKTTFRELPSNSIYALAFLTPLYFGYLRALRTGSLKRMTELVGSSLLAHVVLFLIALVAIPFGALLVKVVVRLFGKRLTLVKLMNIYGYALVPRLAVSIPASICFAMLPEDTKAMMLLGEVPGWFIALTALGGIVFPLLYLPLVLRSCGQPELRYSPSRGRRTTCCCRPRRLAGRAVALSRCEQMNRLLRIQGFTALLCLMVYAVSLGFLPYSPLRVLWLGASLILALLGLRSPARYDRSCAKVVLVLTLALIGFSWFMPAVRR